MCLRIASSIWSIFSLLIPFSSSIMANSSIPGRFCKDRKSTSTPILDIPFRRDCNTSFLILARFSIAFDNVFNPLLPIEFSFRLRSSSVSWTLFSITRHRDPIPSSSIELHSRLMDSDFSWTWALRLCEMNSRFGFVIKFRLRSRVSDRRF